MTIDAAGAHWPLTAGVGESGSSVIGADEIEALYLGHYVSLCRTARLIVDDPGRAEELVQDAFARTFRSRRGVRDAGSALAYVRRAVVHACHSELRRRLVERRIGVGAGGERLDMAAPPAVVDARPVDWFAERDEVARALRTLPRRQREAVVLRYYADLDEASIAHAMGCTVGTVKSQLSKAKQHLSLLLVPKGER